MFLHKIDIKKQKIVYQKPQLKNLNILKRMHKKAGVCDKGTTILPSSIFCLPL